MLYEGSVSGLTATWHNSRWDKLFSWEDVEQDLLSNLRFISCITCDVCVCCALGNVHFSREWHVLKNGAHASCSAAE